MKVLETKVLRGPNYWSVTYERLIVLTLDIEELEDRPTDEIEGFADRLEKMFPGMYKDRCSVGKPGGFFQRVRKGTWMGHVIEHIALELQTLAGMHCGFGRTRGTGTRGVYNVIFAYEFEHAGLHAGKAAIEIAKALIECKPYDIQKEVEYLEKIKKENFPGLSTGSIIEEIDRRYIPRMELDEYIIFGTGVYQKRIQATLSSETPYMGVSLAGDKDVTKNLLKKYAVPIPEGVTIYDESELEKALGTVGFPIVIKPLDGNHGRGISTNIRNYESALAAFKIAQKISRTVIVEKFVTGEDYRLLVVNYKFIGAIKRIPPYVLGDGRSTLKELIDKVNDEPRRQSKPENILGKIEVDELTLSILKKQGYTLDSVLKTGERLYLKDAANVSSGGMPIDVTDEVHPYNILQAERMARIVGLDICGLDIISQDLKIPMKENGAAVVEVNAAPGIRMHIAPAEGKSRPAAKAIVDMLFPKGQRHSIPLVAVTGTNGKTTTVRLIAHIAQAAGLRTGYTTTDGVYIDGFMMEKGDCSGPKSARSILKDPSIEFAVLESARGGILREGLGFSSCDVGIVTNIDEDHLGLKGIDTLEELAKVKSVVPETVNRKGYAVLNADDDLAYKMRENVVSKVSLFTVNPKSKRIKEHLKEGGMAAFVEEGRIVIYEGDKKTEIKKIKNIPLCFAGKAEFMVQNTLAAVLAAYTQNISVDIIKEALGSFAACPEQTPGRMNMFDFGKFKVMVDYVHNAAGLRAIGKFLKLNKAPYNIGIIAAAGDRRDEDLVEIGRVAAGIFDEIILRRDVDLRGRTNDEIERLIEKGIREINPKLQVTMIPDEAVALDHAIKSAKKGTLITLSSETVMAAINIVRKKQSAYKEVKQKKEPA